MLPSKYNRAAWLAVGTILGLCVGGFWPHAPSHASATAQVENFAIATGAIDQGLEGVFFLDPLTGDLSTAVLSPRTGKFIAFFKTNVLEPLGIDPDNKPQLLMVTGDNQFQRTAGSIQLGTTVVYVTDASSGTVAAFGVPWSRQIASSNQPAQGALVPLDKLQLRAIEVREP